ncbi:rhodanese-like domain-containing protein [Natrialba asiatica]|uniref:Rhodanese n=1 Tax=Natrialba asiatica (strain ATCC 700177 / DSM 12278 / JCM 9576 / FERM P-10747 / NBRC 102637 / 172P1) TaxID=29540 RepID=M0B2P0_NATA1|nr:rhodanese-like domain-containing protein [Natrialba asiatica]ELZ04832.1 rhodanese [Natrialba asiatica DSM 12278]
MDGEISPDEVNDLLNTDTDDTGANEANADADSDAVVRVVDIRDERSFAHSRIPGSENIPFQELTGRVDELEDADRIVTVCPHGKASVQAAQLLGSYEGTADARIESMAGGLEKYGLKYGLAAGDRESDGADEPASTNAESPF